MSLASYRADARCMAAHCLRAIEQQASAYGSGFPISTSMHFQELSLG